jgi:hypothetical protein
MPNWQYSPAKLSLNNCKKQNWFVSVGLLQITDIERSYCLRGIVDKPEIVPIEI